MTRAVFPPGIFQRCRFEDVHGRLLATANIEYDIKSFDILMIQEFPRLSRITNMQDIDGVIGHLVMNKPWLKWMRDKRSKFRHSKIMLSLHLETISM